VTACRRGRVPPAAVALPWCRRRHHQRVEMLVPDLRPVFRYTVLTRRDIVCLWGGGVVLCLLCARDRRITCPLRAFLFSCRRGRHRAVPPALGIARGDDSAWALVQAVGEGHYPSKRRSRWLTGSAKSLGRGAVGACGRLRARPVTLSRRCGLDSVSSRPRQRAPAPAAVPSRPALSPCSRVSA